MPEMRSPRSVLQDALAAQTGLRCAGPPAADAQDRALRPQTQKFALD